MEDRLVPTRSSYILISIAILSWGLSTPFIEFGLKYLNPLPYLAYRFLLATIILTPFVLINKRVEVTELLQNKWVWFIGLSETFGLTVQYLGQEQGVPSGLAALLSLLFLLIVPFLSVWILNESLELIHLIAVAIGLIGVLLISTEGTLSNLTGGSTLGVGLLLSAAFGYAVYITTTSRLTTIEKPDVDTFALFYIVLSIISVNTIIVTLIFDAFPSIQSIDNRAFLWLGLLTLFPTLVAFLAYFEALKEISANSASVLLLIQVIVPFIIDIVFLDRFYSLWVWFGSIIILVAMVIVVSIPYRKNSISTIFKRYGIGD